MKTICRLADSDTPNISLYLFEDNKPVSVEADRTVVGDPANPDMIIMDCSSHCCVLKEGVTDPGDWYGWKYTYTDGAGWELNPTWVDPRT